MTHHLWTARRSRAAFSLIELVIVIIILGALTAIALPRLSRGSDGAHEAALQADLKVLRNAIEMYRLDHGSFPPLSQFEAQLKTPTNKDGSYGGPGPKLGPYLIAVPELPLGMYEGSDNVKAPAQIPPTAEVSGAGWLYDEASGSIWANATGYFDR